MNYGESDGRALLDRMTAAEEQHHTLDDSQIEMILQLMVVKFFTESPGVKGLNLSCVVNRVPGGWDVELRKPDNQA